MNHQHRNPNKNTSSFNTVFFSSFPHTPPRLLSEFKPLLNYTQVQWAGKKGLYSVYQNVGFVVIDIVSEHIRIRLKLTKKRVQVLLCNLLWLLFETVE